MVANTGDLDCTQEYLWDRNWRLLETRFDNGNTAKQHVWGGRYIDDLVQVSGNTDPYDEAEQLCDANYYPMQNLPTGQAGANYNVIGLTDESGNLVERYEYTPYGQRTVFTSAGTNDPLAHSPLWDPQRAGDANVTQPYSVCDIGHQGLMHDNEFELIGVRNRYLHPRTGRWTQRDLMDYPDGMSLYEAFRSDPASLRDPGGLAAGEAAAQRALQQGRLARAKRRLYLSALRDYAREQQRLEQKQKTCLVCEPDLRPLARAQDMAGIRLRSFINEHRKAVWRMKDYFAESDAIYFWEHPAFYEHYGLGTDKLRTVIGAMSFLRVKPFAITPQSDERLWNLWMSKRLSVYHAWHSLDSEIGRVLDTTNSIITTLEYTELAGEVTVTAFSGVALIRSLKTAVAMACKQGGKLAGAKAALTFVAKTAGRFAATTAMDEYRHGAMRRLGLSDDEIKMIDHAAALWRGLDMALRAADMHKLRGKGNTDLPDDYCFVGGTLVRTADCDKPIENLVVGDRVLTTNDEAAPGEEDEEGGDDEEEIDSGSIDPRHWRVIELRMPCPGTPSDIIDVRLLRPTSWLGRTKCKVGGTIDFALPEMGLSGPARVVSIKPCPRLRKCAGRLVLATVTHLNGYVFQLMLEGLAEPLEPTGWHRLYSETRGAWVPVRDLRVGEELRTQTGRTRIVSIRRKPGAHRVYNLEVRTKHCYYVSKLGVLSHNEEPCRPGTRNTTPSPAVPGSPYDPREVSKRQSERRRSLGLDPDPDTAIPDQGPGRNVKGRHSAGKGTPHSTQERNVNPSEEHSRIGKGNRGPYGRR